MDQEREPSDPQQANNADEDFFLQSGDSDNEENYVTLEESGPRVAKKRRREVSPATMESETQRLRVDSCLDALASLSAEDCDMVGRAAEVGLVLGERPRAIKIRHVVSPEFPVPHEV